jgi:hypothetical protein
MREGQKKLTKRGVSVLLITVTAGVIAIFAIASCAADPGDSSKGGSHDTSASATTSAPLAGAPAPSIVIGGPPPTPGPSSERPVSSSPPDTADYSKPARPSQKTP